VRRTLDLSSLVCVCGARVSFHRDAHNAQLSCAEAIDRQLMFSRELPQTQQEREPVPMRAHRAHRQLQIVGGAANGAVERMS